MPTPPGNPAEYWAEIVQSYFDCNRVNNWNHGPIGTREQLKLHDPEGYELVRTTLKLRPAAGLAVFLAPEAAQRRPAPRPAEDRPFLHEVHLGTRVPRGRQEGQRRGAAQGQRHHPQMFAYRHDLLKALIGAGVKLVVLGPDEKLSDLPEYREPRSPAVDPLARYVDYSPETKTLVVAEENVLGDPDDPGVGPNQVIRLLAQAAHDVAGTRPVDPNWEKRGSAVQQYELRVKRLDVRFDERLAELYKHAIAGREVEGDGRLRAIAANTGPPASWLTSTPWARPRPRPMPPTRSRPARPSRPTIRTCTPW